MHVHVDAIFLINFTALIHEAEQLSQTRLRCRGFRGRLRGIARSASRAAPETLSVPPTAQDTVVETLTLRRSRRSERCASRHGSPWPGRSASRLLRRS